MSDPSIIDAHHHYWDLALRRHPWLCNDSPIPFRYGDYRPIRRSHLPADYARDTLGHRIVGVVHIEAEWDPADPLGETRWLHGLLADDPLPQVMVAQAWLDRNDVEEVLAAQASFPRVRGIRHKPRAAERADSVDRTAPGSMSNPRWRAGYRLLADFGFSFDLQCPYWHLREAADLAEAYPDTQMILNHTGLPSDRSPQGFAAWKNAMKTAATMPNIAVKISGLGNPTVPWSLESVRPIVLETLEIFGKDRCMFASNYPVDRLVASFDTIFGAFKAIVADLPRGEQEALFAGNAVRIYRIPPPAGTA